jgi:predicted Zn finger-like uncharacterized protein
MKISCPKCNAGGTIPDHDIPEAGRYVSCPRCNEGFTVVKPRSGADVCLVDTCPACRFSTFSDETFSDCPKCGVSVKVFVERQREEQLSKHNQELLEKKFNNRDTAPPPPETVTAPVADFIDNLHPVNLIGWGVATMAIIVVVIALFEIVGFDGAKIQAQLLEEREEQVSSLMVFLHYGLIQWLKFFYGLSALTVSILFMKRLKVGLNAMNSLLWATIIVVPLLYIISFISWTQAPIPHILSGYLVKILNIIFMSLIVGAPLFLLKRYLHNREITSVINL